MFVNIRAQVLLWAAQRISAAVLALCVVAHLVTMIYAVRNGLSAAEILGRTRGNFGWFAFYAVFVVAVSIHAPIGLRSVLTETFDWRGRGLEWTVFVIGIALAFFGFRAVWAVFL
jgi:fumarate reductase subunit C